MLTLARADQDVTELEAVSVAEVARVCWNTVATPDADLVIDTNQLIKADHSQFQQLVVNAFRNAIEHGGTGVTVRIGDLPEQSGLFIEDDGSGVPAADRERVFEPGFSTTTEGTGLGMAIIHDVAEAHGWDESVTSSAAGGGRLEISGVDTATTG